MPGIPQSLAGVGLTAVGVAVIRARESRRADALVDDPYAHLFATAAEADFLARDAPEGATQHWAQLLDLVERFHDGRIVATRYFDDYLAGAIGAGCRQIVDVGAGLDTRALRLPRPEDVVFFEIDLPAMFEFKERVLAGHDDGSHRRVLVAGDLRDDWYARLVGAGFDPALPTAWLEEGVLAYLAPQEAAAVLNTITAVSVPGSRLAKAAMTPPRADDETYRRMRAFVGESTEPSAGVSGTDRDNAYRLGEDGWSLSFVSHADLAARLGRPAGVDHDATAQAEYLTATRL